MAGLFSSRFVLAVAALGLSGCLLFTNPINKAPVVTIIPPPDTVYRGQDVYYTVQVTDDRDGPLTIKVHWYDFKAVENGCNYVTPGSWANLSLITDSPPESSDAPHKFTATTTDVKCVCVLATDHDGAQGSACQRVAPSFPKSIAQITPDYSGIPSATSFPLCGQAHVTGRYSTLPAGSAGDRFSWNWSGSDPAGNPLLLSTCDSTPAGKPDVDRDRCFYVPVAGNYTINLQIIDTPPANPAGNTMPPVESDPVSYVVVIGKDTPPCLQITSPDLFLRQIFPDPTNPKSQNFEALSVKDDCEPYPAVNSKTTSFFWFIYEPDPLDPTKWRWVRQTNNSNLFVLSSDKRVGDETRLRLEVRDGTYDPNGPTCASDTDICYDPTPGASPGCVRWTTWTVRF